MTKPTVTWPDVEELVVDHLKPLTPEATVAIGVPTDWRPESTPHVSVSSDGVVAFDGIVLAQAIVRLVARAATTGDAKKLAARSLGRLAAHPGGGGIASVQPLTGPLASLDPATGAQIAAVTARVNVRATTA